MAPLKETARQVWRSAELWIGFHRRPDGEKRTCPRRWQPTNARAVIDPDTDVREAYAVVRSGECDKDRDVRIGFSSDRITLRAGRDLAWQSVSIEDQSILIEIDGLTLRVGHDGSVRRDDGTSTTWLEPDGAIIKQSETLSALMSGDGAEMTRRTITSIAAITPSGILLKER